MCFHGLHTEADHSLIRVEGMDKTQQQEMF